MELHSYGIHVHGLHPTMPMELEAAGEALAPVGGGSHNAISTPGHNQHIVEPAVTAARRRGQVQPRSWNAAPLLTQAALAVPFRYRSVASFRGSAHPSTPHPAADAPPHRRLVLLLPHGLPQ